MTLTTLTIGSNEYVAYASVAEADILLAVDPIRSAVWAALSTDAKSIKLVAATARIDLLRFRGKKTDPEQAREWPRTGLGADVPDNQVPKAVENATIYLAGTIAINPAAAGQGGTGANQKRVKAGSAEVEFFSPTKGVPLQDETAWTLLKPFIVGKTGALGFASGTDVDPLSPGYGDLTEGFA